MLIPEDFYKTSGGVEKKKMKTQAYAFRRILKTPHQLESFRYYRNVPEVGSVLKQSLALPNGNNFFSRLQPWFIGAAGGVIEHDEKLFASVCFFARARVLAETALTWQTIASASNAANRGHRRNKDTLDLGRKEGQHQN